MPKAVSDARSNHPDQVAHIAGALGNSKHRLKVFLFIHKGKKKFKTATEIARGTGLSRKRVLEEGKRLVHKEVVEQDKIDGEIGYYRDAVSYANQKKIVSLRDKKKLAAFATKSNPKVTVVKVSAPKSLVRTAIITLDAIDSFDKVKRVHTAAPGVGISETKFKQGMQRIVGEKGRFKDWGGETSDLWTTKVRHQGRRVACAFAFKGPGTKGVLVPGKLGKNGDQIQRLFQEDADIYLVQYVGQIAPSVMVNMAPFAQSKSLSTGRKVYYGIVDGNDSARLIDAYPKAFRAAGKKSHS